MCPAGCLSYELWETQRKAAGYQARLKRQNIKKEKRHSSSETQRRKIRQDDGPGPKCKSLPDSQLGMRRPRRRCSLPNAEVMMLPGPEAGE